MRRVLVWVVCFFFLACGGGEGDDPPHMSDVENGGSGNQSAAGTSFGGRTGAATPATSGGTQSATAGAAGSSSASGGGSETTGTGGSGGSSNATAGGPSTAGAAGASGAAGATSPLLPGEQVIFSVPISIDTKDQIGTLLPGDIRFSVDFATDPARPCAIIGNAFDVPRGWTGHTRFEFDGGCLPRSPTNVVYYATSRLACCGSEKVGTVGWASAYVKPDTTKLAKFKITAAIRHIVQSVWSTDGKTRTVKFEGSYDVVGVAKP